MAVHSYTEGKTLRAWVTGQIAWGMFLAMVFSIGVASFVLVIWGMGHLLSERSRETPSPYPNAAIEFVQTVQIG
jgi:hypothetical protein